MNKIENAVAPLKELAIAHTRMMANERIERVLRDLEEAGNDAHKYAPYPKTIHDRAKYMAEKSHHDFVRSITKLRDGYLTGRRMNDPEFRVRDDAKIEAFLEQVAKMAAESYDAYVSKLNHKIGVVVEASLRGNNIWYESFLDVVKEDGSVECWKTKTITNYSKFGMPFVQYPTRKVKK